MQNTEGIGVDHSLLLRRTPRGADFDLVLSGGGCRCNVGDGKRRLGLIRCRSNDGGAIV